MQSSDSIRRSFDLSHLGHACLSHYYGQYQFVMPIVSCHIIIQVFIYNIWGVREFSDIPFKLVVNILLCVVLIIKEPVFIIMTNSIFFGFERTVAGFDDARFISGGGGVG